MDRNEAMLRELNLYPQWVLRNPVLRDAMVAQVPSLALEPVDEPIAPMPAVVMVEAAQDVVETHANEQTDVAPPSNALEVLVSDVPFVPASTWSELITQVRDCQHCDLRAGCTQTVFGVGDTQADWLFIGDMPRADEELHGVPFAAEVGYLLDNMLAAIQLKRDTNVYIANVVKCRPSEDRHPSAAEIAQCLPYLQRQIELVQPKVIVALGKIAASSLLGVEVSLDELRGVLHDYQGIPVIVTYHPAYLLRKPTAKAQAWQDLCFAVDVMSEA